ncbi:MAG: 1-acyl-sn-glycerol-3-phosphate acyltransferase [Clostridia bacterium]|nr:1-acyl-sn-glycerol-3-phosphate acyltransferase [Clostridia bacterium]
MFIIMKKLVNIFICHILYHVKYENIEQLNQYERCLICPNHSNIFDPAFIFPKTDNLYIMAKSELFKNPILAKAFRHYHVFPIQREKSDVSGVRYVMNLFEKQEKIKLLMFPEGGILKKELRRTKIRNGAVHIAGSLNIPIIPVSITENPKLFHRVIVTVKKPIFPKEEVLNNKEKLQETSNELLKKIYE